MKLTEALLAYLEHLTERGLSTSHIKSVNGRLARFVADPPDQPVSAITGAKIAGHFRRLEDDGGLAKGTMAGHKSTHRAFWRWCQEQGLIAIDPSTVLKHPDFRYSFLPVHHQAADETAFHAVLSAIPAFIASRDYSPRDVRDALAVSLAADSAARRGEIWSIRRRELEKALKQPLNLRAGGHVYHVAGSGKTGQANIRFFENSADLARMWLKMLPAGSIHVFASTKTWQRLPRDYMNSAFKRLCAFAGVDPFQWQSVRKRVVTDMIELTGNITAGQLLAGHSSEKTTLAYYNQVQQSSVDAAAGQLARRRSANGDNGDSSIADGFFARVQPPES